MVNIDKLKEIMNSSDVLKDPDLELREEMTLEKIGLDSLDTTMLNFELNQEFQMELKISKKDEIGSILSRINEGL